MEIWLYTEVFYHKSRAIVVCTDLIQDWSCKNTWIYHNDQTQAVTTKKFTKVLYYVKTKYKLYAKHSPADWFVNWIDLQKEGREISLVND